MNHKNLQQDAQKAKNLQKSKEEQQVEVSALIQLVQHNIQVNWYIVTDVDSEDYPSETRQTQAAEIRYKKAVTDHWAEVFRKEKAEDLAPSIQGYNEAVASYKAAQQAKERERQQQQQQQLESDCMEAEFLVAPGNDNQQSLSLVLMAASDLCDISKLRARLEKGADINYNKLTQDYKGDTRNINGDTALHNAMRRGDRESSEFLLQKHADVKMVNMLGNTALHQAAMWQNDVFVKLLFDPRYNKQDMAPIINIQNKEGKTALHIAAEGKKKSIISVLLEQGADSSITDFSGNTYQMVG